MSARKLSLFAGFLISLTPNTNANEISAKDTSASDRYMYIGGSVGISEPVVKAFSDKDTGAKFRMKQSRMMSAYVGYSFYPNMMIEISAEYKPKYNFAYLLPATNFTPITPGRTQVSSNIYMLNLIYQADKELMGLKPYVTFGAGLARINIKQATSSADFFVAQRINNGEFFRIKKNTVNCLAWQVGGGFVRELSENIDIDFGMKLQVVNDIKLKYDNLDQTTGAYAAQKPIKKTIGVGEFTLGFTFKLPV